MALSPQTEQFLRNLSLLVGWTYTLAWCGSFYPQIILNWRRRSTRGSAMDFAFLNLVCFTCYLTSTAAFLLSPTIRSQYAARHPQSPEPTTRINDLAFGVHAVIMALVTFLQYVRCVSGFEVPTSQRITYPVRAAVTFGAIMVAIIVILVLSHNTVQNQDPMAWAWVDVIYAIGNVKLIGTFLKYIPQVALNYRRKSTAGWAINQILLDIVGGSLSIVQLTIDAGLQKDWSGLVGNPLKLGLGFISISYDIILITQHYVIYRRRPVVEIEEIPGSKSEVEENQVARDERTPLLRSV